MTIQDINEETTEKLCNVISRVESGKINIYSAILKAYSLGQFHAVALMNFVEKGDKNET